MTSLLSRDSFLQDLMDFRRDFDQIFSRMLSGTPFWGEERTGPVGVFAPAVESYVDKDGRTYHLRVSLPGVDPKNVQIQLQGNVLTISGERKESRTAKDVDYLHNEMWYGRFERTVTLPEAVEAEKLNAEYQNGVLEITAPVAAAALPRRIEIKTAPASRQIAA